MDGSKVVWLGRIWSFSSPRPKTDLLSSYGNFPMFNHTIPLNPLRSFVFNACTWVCVMSPATSQGEGVRSDMSGFSSTNSVSSSSRKIKATHLGIGGPFDCPDTFSSLPTLTPHSYSGHLVRNRKGTTRSAIGDREKKDRSGSICYGFSLLLSDLV